MGDIPNCSRRFLMVFQKNEGWSKQSITEEICCKLLGQMEEINTGSAHRRENCHEVKI